MPISLSCPSCKRALQAKDTHAGQTLKCPSCEAPVTVSATDVPLSLDEAEPVAVAVNSSTVTAKAYNCQNCGSPLTFEPGQSQAICKYCRSQNQITVGADGQITLSLVQKIDAIDGKTDKILDKQDEALIRAQQAHSSNAAGHLLTVTTSEYQHFLEKGFEPEMKKLLAEKNGVGANGCGGCGCLAGAFLGFTALVNIGAPHSTGGVVFLFFLMAAGSIGAGIFVSYGMHKAVQEKMDVLTHRKEAFEKRIAELRSTISHGL